MTSEQFAQRVTELTPTLYKICYAQLPRACDREDAVQGALEKAWKNRARLREERYFDTWLIRIALNECHAIQRRAGREIPTDVVDDRIAPPSEDSALHDALLKLHEKLRVPLVLHYMQGYAIDEIARMLRVPQGTVKTRMRRGREKLRERLEREAFIDA